MTRVRPRPQAVAIAATGFALIILGGFWLTGTLDGHKRPGKLERLDEGRTGLETPMATAATTESLPVIYIITPTYKRLTQKADLVRLSHVRLLPQNFMWSNPP